MKKLFLFTVFVCMGFSVHSGNLSISGVRQSLPGLNSLEAYSVSSLTDGRISLRLYMAQSDALLIIWTQGSVEFAFATAGHFPALTKSQLGVYQAPFGRTAGFDLDKVKQPCFLDVRINLYSEVYFIRLKIADRKIVSITEITEITEGQLGEPEYQSADTEAVEYEDYARDYARLGTTSDDDTDDEASFHLDVDEVSNTSDSLECSYVSRPRKSVRHEVTSFDDLTIIVSESEISSGERRKQMAFFLANVEVLPDPTQD